ncbi:hypothetical protein P154DRAFT_558311 [Amniculicola lignicola CBS 123094]|uniref:Uncharacterized protein n=1 Tax=Amniculicola lignicola CBS 123094 TaxID=1392246 RepID=A0A6A5X4W8_9PLEO|nr:hypothetical protein P154DRAFT_558311 [Amniculicola lignicola CBS 123094]
MKGLLFLLPALLSAALAFPETEKKCEDNCPQVKCAAGDAIKLCQCLNNRETMCKKQCPDYMPLYRPCPMSPPSPTPTPKPTCECEARYCLMIWPDSCYCENAIKKECFDKCGGPSPQFQVCPDKNPIPTLVASVTKKPTTTKTKTKVPTSTPSPIVCGGSRANYLLCPEGYNCQKDPNKPGCGPECDGLGICILAVDETV